MHDMDDLGIFRPPPTDYFCEHPDHRWEAEKFEMDLDDVFTTLPRRFNMMVIPILDRDAFRLEASHIASITDDRTEFFDMLKGRLEARRKELIDMMMRTFEDLACNPNQIEATRHWGHAMRIYRSKSLDAFARFFAGFLRDPTPSSDTAVSASNLHNESLTPRSEASSFSSSNTFNGVSCLSTDVPSRALSGPPTTRERQTSGIANATNTYRKRKRSSTTPTAGSLGADEEEDKDGMRPSKKARFDGDAVEPGRTPSSKSPRRPSSSHVRRARENQLPMPQYPSSNAMPPTTTVTPTASPAPLRTTAPGANGNDSPEQRGNECASQPANVERGRRRQSCLVSPDTKKKKGDMEAGHRIVHNATDTDPRQGGGQHDPPAKRRRAHAHTRNAKKSASRYTPGPRTFYELDHKGKARLVMAATPRKADRGRLLSNCQVKTRQARVVD
ncbi:hypothetical protein LA080_011820 [Diaporthe eres]|uniref:Uncharacterized protein n=1 Tax=Diaporthe vaccinii TaxID=105482 RepID=A0ABR4EI82_9PEZI|nr:hypothetical protein LA080_011820 [Diaporthe eres]